MKICHFCKEKTTEDAVAITCPECMKNRSDFFMLPSFFMLPTESMSTHTICAKCYLQEQQMHIEVNHGDPVDVV